MSVTTLSAAVLAAAVAVAGCDQTQAASTAVQLTAEHATRGLRFRGRQRAVEVRGPGHLASLDVDDGADVRVTPGVEVLGQVRCGRGTLQIVLPVGWQSLSVGERCCMVLVPEGGPFQDEPCPQQSGQACANERLLDEAAKTRAKLRVCAHDDPRRDCVRESPPPSPTPQPARRPW